MSITSAWPIIELQRRFFLRKVVYQMHVNDSYSETCECCLVKIDSMRKKIEISPIKTTADHIHSNTVRWLLMSYASLNLDTEIYWWNHVVYILTRYFKFVTDLGIYCFAFYNGRDPEIAGLHVMSRRPCWRCAWSRTKHFSPLGTKIKFLCKFFEKKFYCSIEHCWTLLLASLSRGCNPRIHFAKNHKRSSYLISSAEARKLPKKTKKTKKKKYTCVC